MKLSNLRKTMMATAAGMVLALGAAAPALAAPVPSSTLSPLDAGFGTQEFVTNHILGTSSELLHASLTGHTADGWLRINGFALNGAPLFGTGLGSNYLLYLTYHLEDTYASGIPNTAGSTSNLQVLDFKFLVDRNMDTTFTQANAGVDPGTSVTEATVDTNKADDLVLAYGGLIRGVAGFDSQGGAYLNSTQTFAVCTGAGSATLQGMPVTGGLAARQSDCTSGAGNAFFKLPQPFFGLAFDEFNNTTQGFQVNPGAHVVAITQAGGSVDFNRIPEPGSLALLGLGLLGVGVNARRRRAG